MFIYRDKLAELKKHLPKKEISLILGPRQSGKTTLILTIKKDLEEKGEKTIYFNLDRLDDYQFFKTQKTLLQKIEFEIGKKSGFVFIDEIQRIKNAGLFLKGLYDYLSPYKFIATGSGSLELKEDIIEPLTGRKRLFYLYPLSFAEFFRFKTSKELSSFNKFYQLRKSEAQALFDEYTIFGGYPKVVLAETAEEKQEQLQEIYTSYLEKDVKSLMRVEKDISYQHLLRYLAAEIGSLTNKAEISRNLKINIKTLNRYLYFLEKTYVISLVRPFFKNPTKELTKTPKTYFIDLGLRNYTIGRFNSFFTRDDKGKLLENFVFRQISDKEPVFGIFFWRTETKAEVDFVTWEKGLLPIEVKASKMPVGFVDRGLISFMEKYQLKRGIIVHLGKEGEIKKKNKIVQYKRVVI